MDQKRRSRTFYDWWAPFYDWANQFAAVLRGSSDARERRKAVGRMRLSPGDRVLEVGVGTGTNLPIISSRLGPAGNVVGLDISSGMLRQCRRKLRRKRVKPELTRGEPGHLPFADAAFDAVLHHGGIAEFGDKKGAIDEMVRVSRPGGKVVICDPGLPSDRPLSWINRSLLKLQPLYAQEPPLDLIPASALEVKLNWFRGDAWYLIEFVKPPEPSAISR